MEMPQERGHRAILKLKELGRDAQHGNSEAWALAEQNLTNPGSSLCIPVGSLGTFSTLEGAGSSFRAEARIEVRLDIRHAHVEHPPWTDTRIV